MMGKLDRRFSGMAPPAAGSCQSNAARWFAPLAARESPREFLWSPLWVIGGRALLVSRPMPRHTTKGGRLRSGFPSNPRPITTRFVYRNPRVLTADWRVIDNIRIVRIMIRMLRTSSLMDALVSRTKQQVLSATLSQPERRWYLLELARHLGVRPSSLQRELKLLAAAGILKRDQNGNRVYFQADAACPIFAELAQILAKTVGIVDVLREILEPLRDRITVAFVYGSVAASSERSTSDIDFMVIRQAIKRVRFRERFIVWFWSDLYERK